ncbi:MAG: hypothetical protein J07HB67_01178 [halophilic archaeon J07HB67]|jgi:hypothetical protein|nr:MAG: hypothetical protein J07HB67_01178 [halophilic archaeon J07HB67]
MPEQGKCFNEQERSATRRTLLRSLGALSSVSAATGVVSASEEETSKYNGLHDFPSVADEYRRHRERGRGKKAREILSKNDIGYGHTSAVPVETSKGVESLTTNSDGPYAQDESQAAPQDLWEKSGAQISIGAVKLTEEYVQDFPYKLPRYETSLQLSLSDGNLFSPQSAGPADVAAISFEGSHWLPQTQSSARSPTSVGEGGSVEKDEIKSDHFRWRFNEPLPRSVNDGSFIYFFRGQSYMHPNAEGISQFYGNYSHAWSLVGGIIDKISIGPGVFTIGTSTGANDWELTTDPLTVTP